MHLQEKYNSGPLWGRGLVVLCFEMSIVNKHNLKLNQLIFHLCFLMKNIFSLYFRTHHKTLWKISPQLPKILCWQPIDWPIYFFFFFVGQLHGEVPTKELLGNLTVLMSKHLTSSSIAFWVQLSLNIDWPIYVFSVMLV